MLGKFMKKKKKMLFGQKIMLTYIFLLAIVSIGFVAEFWQTISYAFQSNVDYLRQYNAQVNLSLNSIISDGEQFQYVYLIDSNVKKIFNTDENLSEEKQEENRQYMRDTLKKWASINPYALRVSIELQDGRVYSSLNDDLTDYISNCKNMAKNIDWSDNSKKYYTSYYNTEIYQVEYCVVTRITKIYDLDGKTCLGTIYLDLNWDDIRQKFLDTVIQDMDNGFVVLNEDGVMLDSTQTHIIENGDTASLIEQTMEVLSGEKENMDLRYNDTNYLITGVENDETGWYVLGFTSKDIIYKKSFYAMRYSLVIAAVVLIVGVILAKLLSKQISRPVSMLSKVMTDSVDGKVKLFTEENVWNDEVGELIENYNRMGERLNDTVQRVYIYQLNQKQAQLRMLQYQINPHFLYNALNTMSSIARLEEVDYIPEIADSLSNMFRYSIKGNDFVEIKDELKQLENYLSIIQIRFPEHYIVEFDVQEDLRSYAMLKLVIQPLVENSINHAFKKKRKKDYLKISVYEESMDKITISVYDDGIGMSESKVNELNQLLREVKPDEAIVSQTGGIGLTNVNARLKNYYGEDYHLYVDSREGEYTCIYFSIKKKRLEDV